jgi:hypothetical protein
MLKPARCPWLNDTCLEARLSTTACAAQSAGVSARDTCPVDDGLGDGVACRVLPGEGDGYLDGLVPRGEELGCGAAPARPREPGPSDPGRGCDPLPAFRPSVPGPGLTFNASDRLHAARAKTARPMTRMKNRRRQYVCAGSGPGFGVPGSTRSAGRNEAGRPSEPPGAMRTRVLRKSVSRCHLRGR